MNGQSIKYISLSEASKLTSYSQEYISLLCRQKKMKGTKIGRNWVTTKEWVERYINKTKGNGQNIIPVKIKSAEAAPAGLQPVPNVFQASEKENEASKQKELAANQFPQKNTPVGDNISPVIGKLILTAIVCSLFVSGFIFLQLGLQKGAIKTNLSQVVKETSADAAEGIISISGFLDAIKKETAKFANYKIAIAGNSLNLIKNESAESANYKITAASSVLNNIKNKTISTLKNLSDKKPDSRVAGVSTEDLNEGGGAISNERIDLTNEEKKGMVVIPLEGDKNSPENIDMINRISSSFSDDVDIKPNEDGASGMINPKNNPEENYLYLMVPVKEEANIQ